MGRSESGVDCGGLIDLATRNCGLDLASYLGGVRRPGYSRRLSPELIELTQRYASRTSNPVPGCVVVFRFPGEGYPRHYGICTEYGVVHADAKRGCVVHHGLRAHWLKWVHSYWLVPGVDYGP